MGAAASDPGWSHTRGIECCEYACPAGLSLSASGALFVPTRHTCSGLAAQPLGMLARDARVHSAHRQEHPPDRGLLRAGPPAISARKRARARLRRMVLPPAGD